MQKKYIKRKFDSEQLQMKFKHMSPGTIQLNNAVERVFAMIYTIMHAIMYYVGIPDKIQGGIWTECAATGAKLENDMTSPGEKKPPKEKFYGKRNRFLKFLHPLI